MGLVRNYSMKISVNDTTIAKTEYFTEDAVINDYLKILTNNHILHMADKGEFRTTVTPLYPEKTYNKNYELDVDIPPMKIVIRKKDRGNIIKDIFIEKIMLYRGRYEGKNN